MTTKIKGIDISYHDGTIDFKKVVADGIKFIVLRQGYRNTIDKKFLEYAKECKKHNIPIMVYHFIYTDGATPKQNAQSTVSNMKKAGLDIATTWISADLEYDTWKKNGEKCTKAKCTKYTKEYLDQLKKLGCKKLFIYMNDDYYENYYESSLLKQYPIWLANFSRSTPKHDCVMYQYSETGKVSGINSKVDMNWLYDKTMLNKISTPEPAPKKAQAIALGKVTANWLNVRTDAGIDKKIASIGPLKKDFEFQILNQKKDKNGLVWYYIKIDNVYGYVSSKYVKITQKKSTQQQKTSKKVKDFDKYYNSKSIHYISNCSSDERGRYSGGTAGDQTGKEWVLKAWYNRPWNYVLRHPKESVRLKIAELGIKAALNNKIGYDQNQRGTYWTQLKKANYDPSKITTACQADCSAGVIANTKAVGELLDIKQLKNLGATYTGDMRSNFKKAGFTILTDKKYLSGYEYLLPGDILLYENHHTATNITKGKKA